MKSYNEVKSILSEIEPTDAMYAKLAQEDISAIEQILDEQEPWLASRAVFALSKFQTRPAYKILDKLASDPRIEIRVSLAFCVKTLPFERSKEIIKKLVKDNEPGVRKFAYQSIHPNAGNEFTDYLNTVLIREKDTYLKEILTSKMNELRR